MTTSSRIPSSAKPVERFSDVDPDSYVFFIIGSLPRRVPRNTISMRQTFGGHRVVEEGTEVRM